MECPHQNSFFNERFTAISHIDDELSISQIADFNDELCSLTKQQSLEEFLGHEDESTEISLLLNSMDSANSSAGLNGLNETESVSEILAILKKAPNSTKNKTSIFNDNYINPFGGNVCRPVCVKKVSMTGKVLNRPFPERVSNPVFKSSILTLN
jgi:hypothetical protein